MEQLSLYSEDTWKRFSEKTGTDESSFIIKKYPQFDPFFNFSEDREKLKNMLSDPSLNAVSRHSFLPFVKILTKTPRFRYQAEISAYGLETKVRPISFASHFDTYVYAYYSFALNEIYQNYIKEKGFDKSVLAYRTDLDGLCNIQFAKNAFSAIKDRIDKKVDCSAIALDITGYFDNIDHNILKEKWCKILNLQVLPKDQYKIFRSLTAYSYVKKDSFLKHFGINLKKKKKEGYKWQSLLDLIPDALGGKSLNEKFNLIRKANLVVTNLPKKLEDGTFEHRGIPQGSSMSALLSNIYLIDFDEWLSNLGKKMGFSYYRYCDDLLIIGKSADASKINKLVVEEIKNYKLQIQDKKTEHIIFRENSSDKVRAFDYKKIQTDFAVLDSSNENRYYKNLQYLGFEFNGQNIYIRPGSLSRYFRKMKGRIVKSVMMAYSEKGKSNKIFKKQLFEKYSHFGKRNFLSYARNAASKTYTNSAGRIYEGMDSKSIRKQLSAHFNIIEREVIKTSEQRFQQEEWKTIKRAAKGKKRKTRKIKY